jgi:hypothetical protein
MVCLVGCKMPAPVPLPQTTLDEQENIDYRNSFMFHLGKMASIQEDQDRWTEKMGTVSPDSAADLQFVLDSLHEYIEKSEAMIENLRSIKPPAHYREFHEKYVEMHQAALVLNKRMALALQEGDQEVLMGVPEEMADTEARYKKEIEQICRRIGATSLNDFLGIPED